MAVAEGGGEVRSLGTIPNRPESVARLIKKLGKPEQLKAWMMEEARDLGEEGPDLIYGAGAIQGDEPPPCGCTAGGGASLLPGLMGLLAVRRRRS